MFRSWVVLNLLLFRSAIILVIFSRWLVEWESEPSVFAGLFPPSSEW